MATTIEQQQGIYKEMMSIASQLESQLDVLDPPDLEGGSSYSASQELLNMLALEREAKAYNSCVAEIWRALSFIETISHSRSPSEVDQANLSQNLLVLLKKRKFLCEEFSMCSARLMQEVQVGIDSSLLVIKQFITTKSQRFYILRKELLAFLEHSTRSVLLFNPAQARMATPLKQSGGSAAPELDLHSFLRMHVQMFVNFVTRRLPNTPLFYLSKCISCAAALDSTVNPQVVAKFYPNGYSTTLSEPFVTILDAIVASSSSPVMFKESILQFLNQRIEFILKTCTSVVSSVGVLKPRVYSTLKGAPPFDTSKVGTETLLIVLLDFLQNLPDKNRIRNSRELKDYLFLNDTPSIPPIHDSPIRSNTQLSLVLRWLAHMHRAKMKDGVGNFNRSHVRATEDGPVTLPPLLYKKETHPMFYYIIYVLSLLLDEREQIVSLINLIVAHYTEDTEPFSHNLLTEQQPLMESACRLMDVCYAYVAVPVLQYMCQLCLGLISNISMERLTFETLDLLQVLHAMLPIVLFTNYTEIASMSVGGLPATDSPCRAMAKIAGIDTTVYLAGSTFVNGMGMNDPVQLTSRMSVAASTTMATSNTGTAEADRRCSWILPTEVINSASYSEIMSSLSPMYTAIIELLNPLASDVVSSSQNHGNYLEKLLQYHYTKTDLELSLFDSLRHDMLILILVVAVKCKEVILSFDDTVFTISTKADTVNVIPELPTITIWLNQQGIFAKSIAICPNLLAVAQATAPSLLEGVAIKDTGASGRVLNQIRTKTGFSAASFVDSNTEFVLQDYLLPAGAETAPTTSMEQKLYYLACVICYKMQPHKSAVNTYVFQLNNMNYLHEVMSSDNGLLRKLVSPEYVRFMHSQLDRLGTKYYEKVWKPAICALGLSRLISDMQHVYTKWHERSSHIITKEIMGELTALLAQAREVALRTEGAEQEAELGTESYVASEIQDDADGMGSTLKPVMHASIKSRRLASTLSSCLPKFESMITSAYELHYVATVPSAALQKRIKDYVLDNVLAAVKQYHALCQFSPITTNAFKNHDAILPPTLQKGVDSFFGGASSSNQLYSPL